MRKRSDNSFKHVISFRVTEDEKDLLLDMATAWGLNVSTLMREVLFLMEEKKPGLLSCREPGREPVWADQAVAGGR